MCNKVLCVTPCMEEVKSIDVIPKTDESDLTPIEKSTLDTLFPTTENGKGNKNVPTVTLTSSTTPTSSTPIPDSIFDTNFTKKAINTVILTVLFVVLHSVNVPKLIESLGKKKQVGFGSPDRRFGPSPTTIFIGKIVVFIILTFLLLYYNS
jgi:hypothetical protein